MSIFAKPSTQMKPTYLLGEQAAIAGLALRLLDCSGAGKSVPMLEDELNRQVYGLFGVSPEETRVIEGGKK